MNRRTNLNLNGSVIDFLHDTGQNCSEIANKALVDRAIELGYENLDGDIKHLEKKLSKFRAHRKAKVKADEHTQRFYLHLLGYLTTAHHPTMVAIRAWLQGPVNREYSSVIGHLGDLTDEKIAGLIASAHTYKGGEKVDKAILR